MDTIYQGINFTCKLLMLKKAEYIGYVLCVLSLQVSVRIKQYKDELLAACLTFVLSLHHDVVALDIKAYIPALQVY